MSSSRNNEVKFNITEAKNFVKYIVKNNRSNAKRGITKKVALELIGDAGLGKTSAILQVAEEEGMDLVKLNLSQIEEIGDLVGFPIKKYTIEKDGEQKMVTEKQLVAWYRAGWSPVDVDPVMSYAPPEWISNRAEAGILLLDDWSRADVRFIQCVMELIDRGEYISWSLPKDWHVVLSSNPDNGEYIVNTIDDAQATRFLTANIKYDEKVWAEWAENNHIDSRCINFMLLNPEAVEGVKSSDGGWKGAIPANPRQWVNFFHTIGNIEDYKSSASFSQIETIGQMAVGQSLTALFLGFINNNMDKLIDPERMVLHENEDQVMAEIKDCTVVKGEYRNDIASVLSIRFTNWLIKYAAKNPIDKPIIERVHNIITGEVFGADLSFTIAKKIYYNARTKFLPLVSRKSFMDYILITS